MLDPLGCHEPLPLVRRFYPIGYELELATNSEDVMAAAEENWGWFQPAFGGEALRVRVAVSEAADAERPETPSFRMMGHLISIISDRANFAVCDVHDGFAFCRLTQNVARDRIWMRQRFLDGMVLCMLTCREVTPIHASCVMKNGRGLLLCGRSGAGKSSMAFACVRSGWTFVTDDVAYLRRGVADRVVLGRPQFMKFVASAPQLFPELGKLPVITDQSGEPALELPTNGISTSFQAPIDAIVFLNRVKGSSPDVRTVSRKDALDRLMADMPSFGESIYTLHRNSIDILVQTTKLAEFTYWELGSAVGALDTLIRG
jgi:hypothetical protein